MSQMSHSWGRQWHRIQDPPESRARREITRFMDTEGDMWMEETGVMNIWTRKYVVDIRSSEVPLIFSLHTQPSQWRLCLIGWNLSWKLLGMVELTAVAVCLTKPVNFAISAAYQHQHPHRRLAILPLSPSWWLSRHSPVDWGSSLQVQWSLASV